MTDEHVPPIFRANKRRKVLRKRPDSDDQDDDHAAPATVNSDRERGQTPMNGFGMEIEEGDDATSRTDLTRVRKPKKHGIAFSSSDRPTFRTQDDNQETALMVAEPQAIQEANNRFARPTGKAIVQDDRHMSAYIDSKLAEMRAAAATPNSINQPTDTAAELQPTDDLSPDAEEDPQALPPSNPSVPATGPHQPGNQNQPTRRRRGKQPRAPSPSTQARASLIDQIMRESSHTPHYTAPAASTSQPKTSSSNNTATHDDPDAAAAAAFKAEFLAQAEMRNLSRRKPAINASSSAAAATTSHGPKLGGSRAQRERMRAATAAEEGKAKK